MARPVPKPRPRKLKPSTEAPVLLSPQFVLLCAINASDTAADHTAAVTSQSSRDRAIEELMTIPTAVVKSPTPRRRLVNHVTTDEETQMHGKFLLTLLSVFVSMIIFIHTKTV